MLYGGIEEQKHEYLKIGAALMGIDLDGKSKSEETSFEFRDPSEYENMSKEERKKLTDKMMGRHKTWATQKGLNDG